MASSINGLQVSGLASGLDTKSIITSLMNIESAPQTALKTSLTNVQTFVSKLQALNSTVAGIATKAGAAATATALRSATATSSDAGITATATGASRPGSIALQVTQVAKYQTSVSGVMPSWPDTALAKPVINVVHPGGTTVPVTAESTSLDDVVTAINTHDTGVLASKVTVDASASPPTYRLQLQATKLGSAGAFSIQEASGTPTTLPTTTVSPPDDAVLKLYPGTAVETTLTSTDNQFAEVLPGVTVTATAVQSAPATVTVKSDATAGTNAAQALTGQLIQLFTALDSELAASPSAAGSFAGDQSLQTLKRSLLAAVSAVVPSTVSGASGTASGTSVAQLGIALTKTGTISFDANVFAAAMQKDPAGTSSLFAFVAGRVQTAAAAASDATKGYITTKLSSKTATSTKLTGQISNWDDRLAKIKARYEAQYAALETAMSSLNSQSTYLQGQLSGLTTKYGE